MLCNASGDSGRDHSLVTLVTRAEQIFPPEVPIRCYDAVGRPDGAHTAIVGLIESGRGRPNSFEFSPRTPQLSGPAATLRYLRSRTFRIRTKRMVNPTSPPIDDRRHLALENLNGC